MQMTFGILKEEKCMYIMLVYIAVISKLTRVGVKICAILPFVLIEAGIFIICHIFI